MNITFLIGNGFDLNLGLKTSYQDFYKYYLKQKNNDIDITHFKKDIYDNLENWSDAELAFGEYTGKFFDKNTQRFEKCYNDFLSELSKYFEIEQEKIKLIPNSQLIFDSMNNIVHNFYTINFVTNKSYAILSKAMLRKSNESRQFNFINFNYTNVLERFINLYNSSNKSIRYQLEPPIYIHGQVNDCMILGVDNINQISNPLFSLNARFDNYFIKSNAINSIADTTTTSIKQTIESSDIVCVFGMSFGKTDKTWWQTIINWLKKKSDNQLILYIYDPKVNSAIPSNVIDARTNIYRKLFQSNTLKEQEMVKNRIHFSFNKDLFGGLRKCVTIDKTESENNTKELITL